MFLTWGTVRNAFSGEEIQPLRAESDSATSEQKIQPLRPSNVHFSDFGPD